MTESPKLLVTDYTFPNLEHEAEVSLKCGLQLDARQLRSEAEIVYAIPEVKGVLV